MRGFFGAPDPACHGVAMQVAISQAHIAELTESLAAHHGFRTVWMSAEGQLFHTEPDEELEDEGFRYIATLMRPDQDELRASLGRLSPTVVASDVTVLGWDVPAVAPVFT